MGKNYSEKLRDPRWQKKRLEVLERAGWRCESCGDLDATLHVHHGFYRYGLEPWEADDSTLWALCDACHEDATTLDHDLRLEIGRLPLAVQRALFSLIVELRVIRDHLVVMLREDSDDIAARDAGGIAVVDEGQVAGLEKYLHLHPENIEMIEAATRVFQVECSRSLLIDFANKPNLIRIGAHVLWGRIAKP